MNADLLFGLPPGALVQAPPEAVQCSPLVPGATLLDAIANGSARSMTMVVPPGTIERRFALAQALRVLPPGADFVAMGPRDKGGARIRRELEDFGCAVVETSKSHWRLCRLLRPESTDGIKAAIEAGAMRQSADGLWTQPGIFSWDRVDEGSALLLGALGPLSGAGADLGCGIGLLTRAALAANGGITRIDAVDLDGRAVEAARRNVEDRRAEFLWLDVRAALPIAGLDFVVMNPPFHAGGQDDLDLGRIFLRRAREALRVGGVLWMVANRHLPYEAELAGLFAKIETVTQSPRFKVVRAIA